MLELIYTSVPQGLKENSSGFCSVAWTAGMPANLIPPLEQLSAYRALYPFGDPKYERNPVAVAYQRIRYGGSTLSVLSRIAAAGLDYSGRNNKIAHQILLEKEELAAPNFSPVALCRKSHTFVTEWNRPPEELSPRRIVAPRELLRPANHWARYAGRPEWAGFIAEQFLRNPSKAVYVEYPEGVPASDLLLLIAETVSLLTPEQEADFSFNTYFTSLPNGGTCFLRFCPENSPAIRSAERIASNPIIRLLKKNELPPALENSCWGCYARTGTPPENRSAVPEREDSPPDLQPEPEQESPVSGIPPSGEKKRDLHQENLQAENFALRTRLEQSRRRQQLVLGIAILGVVAVAAIAITILLFSRSSSPPEVRSTGGATIDPIPIVKTQTPDQSSPLPRKPQKSEKTIPQKPPRKEAPRKETPPQTAPPAAPPEKASAPPAPQPKQRPDDAEKNRISAPSRKSLSRFLEELASKIADENSYTFSCPLPPELANAEDLSVRLRSIGGNTAKKVLENLSRYIQKIPGGVRIFSTANLPKDGIYDYVPVPDNYLEITVGNRQLHVAKKARGSMAKIDSSSLTDIELFILKGSTEISVPFALNMEIVRELPLGTIERGSATRYDFVFAADSKRPLYFIYRKSQQEEHFLSFLDFRFAKQDILFQTLENWNICQENLTRNTPQSNSEVGNLMGQISKLKKLLLKFEKKYQSFYRDTDPVTFGEISTSRDLKQANHAAKAFFKRKKEYEDFMNRKEKDKDKKASKEEIELFQNFRSVFEATDAFHASNLNLLRDIVEYNKQQAIWQNRKDFEAKLREALLKQIASLPLPDKEMENIKKTINSGQSIALFREGPNRNKTLEQHFTRTWVTRTVKQGKK